MRFFQSALGLFLLGLPVGACARGDCHKNPAISCEGGSGGGGAGTPSDPPTCTDKLQNGDESGVDCGGDCGACDGDACVLGSECKSTHCADGVCCDTGCDGLCETCDGDGSKGRCSALTTGDMGLGDGSCDTLGGCGEVAGSCRCEDGVRDGDETDVDCGGTCKKCGIGSVCQGDGDCTSEYLCRDGRCCNTACALPCHTCDAPEHPGLCLPVAVGAPDDDTCDGGEVCNAGPLCAMNIGGECSSSGQCASNYCVFSGMAGKCVACEQSADCPMAHLCVDGVCRMKVDIGGTCDSDDVCNSGSCVDGVCCDSKCGEPCKGCHPSYTGTDLGTCAPIMAGIDPHGGCAEHGAGVTCNGNGECGLAPP